MFCLLDNIIFVGETILDGPVRRGGASQKDPLPPLLAFIWRLCRFCWMRVRSSSLGQEYKSCPNSWQFQQRVENPVRGRRRWRLDWTGLIPPIASSTHICVSFASVGSASPAQGAFMAGGTARSIDLVTVTFREYYPSVPPDASRRTNKARMPHKVTFSILKDVGSPPQASACTKATPAYALYRNTLG